MDTMIRAVGSQLTTIVMKMTFLGELRANESFSVQCVAYDPKSFLTAPGH